MVKYFLDGNQPAVEDGCQKEWLEAGFLELGDAGLGTKRSHCHGEKEGVQLVDPSYQTLGQQVERIETYDHKKKSR